MHFQGEMVNFFLKNETLRSESVDYIFQNFTIENVSIKNNGN